MKTNDIAIAYVSWHGGGKRRPVLKIDWNQVNIQFIGKLTARDIERFAHFLLRQS